MALQCDSSFLWSYMCKVSSFGCQSGCFFKVACSSTVVMLVNNNGYKKASRRCTGT